VSHHIKFIGNRPIAARALALLLVVAQTFALFVAPAHRVAHATPAIATEQVSAGTHGHSPLSDWFAHEAGSSCDDWNAAFANDLNPGDGRSYIPPVSASPPISHGRLPAPAGSHLYCLSLARAPPRS